MALRIAGVSIDCRDSKLLEDFWGQALSYVPEGGEAGDDGIRCVEDPNDIDVELVFVPVPEAKSVKNRVHLDIGADDRVAEVERLTGLGATVVDVLDTWTVMRDPEGNEFCIIQAVEGDPVSEWRK